MDTMRIMIRTQSLSGDAFEGRDPNTRQQPGFRPSGQSSGRKRHLESDAVALAKWLSEKEGAKYCLPTEAEWDNTPVVPAHVHAIQAVSNPESLLKIGNVFDFDARSIGYAGHNLRYQGTMGLPSLHPWVALRPMPGDFTICMATCGNGSLIGMRTTTIRDHLFDNPQGPADGSVRVRRGGSWHTWVFVTHAHPIATGFRRIRRYTLVGMRLVREVPVH